MKEIALFGLLVKRESTREYELVLRARNEWTDRVFVHANKPFGEQYKTYQDYFFACQGNVDMTPVWCKIL